MQTTHDMPPASSWRQRLHELAGDMVYSRIIPRLVVTLLARNDKRSKSISAFCYTHRELITICDEYFRMMFAYASSWSREFQKQGIVASILQLFNTLRYSDLASPGFTRFSAHHENIGLPKTFSIRISAINLLWRPFPFAKQWILTCRCLKRMAISSSE